MSELTPEQLRAEIERAEKRSRINRTAEECYAEQNPGIGAGATTFDYLKELTAIELSSAHRVLDIGFGEGESLLLCKKAGCPVIAGVDICHSSMRAFYEKTEQAEKYSGQNWGQSENMVVYKLDASHEALPFDDDTFNLVLCTETIEHCANPFHVISEAKRVLEHDGLLLMSFPMPENNFGYGGGQHAHVYPGFLERESYEIFMRQMFFRAMKRGENGASAWYAWRNYKGPGIIDVFTIVAGNYDEEQLFSCLKD